MEQLNRLQALTRLTASEIMATVQALPCSFDYAARFYSVFGRFPTAQECRAVTYSAITAYKNIVTSQEPKVHFSLPSETVTLTGRFKQLLKVHYTLPSMIDSKYEPQFPQKQ